MVVDPSCKYFATTLYESTVTIIIPDIDKTKEYTTPQPLRKISLRSKDGRRRQTQDMVFQHPHDYIDIRYILYGERNNISTKKKKLIWFIKVFLINK